MDVDGFWTLIEQSEQQTTLRAERVAWLEERLSALPAEEIADFAGWWTLAANRGCTWDMYAVYWFLMGSGSSDGFDYFVSWLIGLGREAFEKVADCPDAALDVPQVQHVLELQRSFARDRANRSRGGRRVMWTREEWPEFELLSYVSYEPYRKATGLDVDSLYDTLKARGITSTFPSLPDGEGWDFDDMDEATRRLPRVARYHEDQG